MHKGDAKKIAVVGAGVAGLTATHLLRQKHDVTLIEKDARIGGHTNTVVIQEGADAGTPVDTGFIVMNHRNYPLLTRLFEQLGVQLRDSEMSFGYHDLPSGLQYSGSGLNGLFAQRSNLVNPAFRRMVRDVFRFFKLAEQDRGNPDLNRESLGDYLTRNAFSPEFITHHLMPMGSAIWSTPCEQMMAFPAASFFQFFHNHGLLSLKDRPQWKTVVGGSHDYIRRMRQGWDNVRVRKATSIAGIRRHPQGVELHFEDAPSEAFDEVVIAAHADQALKLLADPNHLEQELLGAWTYTRSRTFLHTDVDILPPLRRVWSAWNFQRVSGNVTCLTYHMNRLQGLKTKHEYLVTLNPPAEPRGIVAEFLYEHPMYTRDALNARTLLAQLNGTNHTWYAGSYFGNGFHEDAVRSAVEVAHALGVEF